LQKDDAEMLDFVTATSNLRAHAFGIEEKTRFKVKEMAGNIIPAIATTNAIIAGLIVMQAFHILAGKFKDCSTTYLVHGGRRATRAAMSVRTRTSPSRSTRRRPACDS